MLLTIDCGNTNVVFAVYDANKQCAAWRCGNYDIVKQILILNSKAIELMTGHDQVSMDLV